MTTPEPSAPEPSEREAFEAAVIALQHRPHARANRILPLDWDDPEPEEGNEGGYAYHATYYAFQLWQARAALKPSPSPVVAPESAKDGEFEAAADLVDKLKGAQTNGEMLAAVLSYRLATLKLWLNPKRPEEGKST